jgi:hypothetical protein
MGHHMYGEEHGHQLDDTLSVSAEAKRGDEAE